jgi:hypothetical protein
MNILEYKKWIDGYFESLLLSEPITKKQVLKLQEKINEMFAGLANTSGNVSASQNKAEDNYEETKLRSPDGWKTASSIDEAADEPPF